MEPLAYYTLGLPRPAEGWGRLAELTANVRQASKQMRSEGVAVRLMRTIFVPEDETCFFLFQAPSAVAVQETAARAALHIGCVAETIAGAKQGDEPRRRPEPVSVEGRGSVS